MSAAAPRARDRKRLVALMAAFAAGTACGLWLWYPIQDQAERAAAAKNWLTQSIAVKRERAGDLPAYRRDVAQATELADTMTLRLPAQLPTAAIDAEIQALAARHGLDAPVVQVGRDARKEFYAKVDYAIALRGPRDALLAFVADFGQGTPLRRVTGLRLTAEPEVGRHAAEIGADFYRYLGDDEMNAPPQ